MTSKSEWLPEPSIEEMLTVGRRNGFTTLLEAFDSYTGCSDAYLFFDMANYSTQYAWLISQIAKKGWTVPVESSEMYDVTVDIDPTITIAQCMEDIGMTWTELQLPPRQYARVKFVCNDSDRHYYPFERDETFIYLGEIPNMKGHCVVISDKDKQFHIGYHISNFVEWNDEEALIFSDTIPLRDE